MPHVTFVNTDGTARTVDAEVGETLFRVAKRHAVPGVVGECGGCQSCATCHVWVRPDFWAAVGPAGELEADLLDLGVTDRRDNSRLACQIHVTPALDGLTVDVPPTQP